MVRTGHIRNTLFKHILQEPLLHFLVAGSILFFYLSYNDETKQKEQIVITQGKITQLLSQFKKTRQREPTKKEKQGLIENQIREDLAFKQGKELGLIENDSIIKRRVQQKIEFMLRDSIAGIEPAREELEAYLMEHKEQYTIAPVYTFKHIYINPEQHDDLHAFILKLQSDNLDKNYRNVGDSIMMQSEFVNISATQIARLFGQEFSKSLDKLSLKQWQGPVKSGYGVHLVFIEKKIPEHIATLKEVEKQLRRDFRADTQKKAIDSFYDELKVQYDVKVEEDQ